MPSRVPTVAGRLAERAGRLLARPSRHYVRATLHGAQSVQYAKLPTKAHGADGSWVSNSSRRCSAVTLLGSVLLMNSDRISTNRKGSST